VLLDVNMPEMNGIEVSNHILQKHPQTKVIILTQHGGEAMTAHLLQLGVHGFLLKNTSARELKLAIETVIRGEKYIHESITSLMQNNFKLMKSAASVVFNKREAEILLQLKIGRSSKEIASVMDLARFDIALSNDRLLTPASRAKLWTPARAELPYGLGWFLGSYRGRRVAWHTGLWEGQYSALYLKVLGDTRAERYTLILLANSDGLRWPTRLDEAAIERSPFAVAFLDAFAPHR